ncbi:MAG: ABC transporter ATP-binding protein [Bacillota bacterium]
MDKCGSLPALEMRSITKCFKGVVANDSVDFVLEKGEIHALLGENGAGKSTLMNVLYGLYTPDEGEIYLNGSRLTLHSPADAIAHRIGMIHQHFMLIPTLTVVENIILCSKMPSPFKLDLNLAANRVKELSKLYGLEIDPWAKVSELSVGAQQRVEILKVLYRGAEILIMDEPTAVLTPNEVQDLFKVLRDIVAEGNSIIFISHKLWEVKTISHRVTVLRAGKAVTTVQTQSVTKEDLASLMVGREVFLQYDRPAAQPGDPVLELKDVYAQNDKGLTALGGISLCVRAGEIVGIAGVDGNGQKELAEVIHGMRHVQSGSIVLGGRQTANLRPEQVLDAGLSHIPEDRHSRGVVLDFSVAENIALIHCDRPPFSEKGIYRPKNVRRVAGELCERFNIKCAGVEGHMSTLSGGNQQKVVLAREISRAPRLLIAAQPCRGLDIGATEFIQKLLLQKRTEGTGILLISSDLDEVLAISDRVLALYEGRIMGEFVPGEKTLAEIGLMMAGGGTEKGCGGEAV